MIEIEALPGSGPRTAVAPARPMRGTRFALLSILVAAVYYAAAKGALQLVPFNHHVAILWPSSAIALGALLIWGTRLLPAVFVGCALVELTTSAAISHAFLYAGMTAVYTGAAYLLLVRVAQFDNRLRRVQDVLAFVLSGVGAVILLKGAGRLAVLLVAPSGASSDALFLAWLSALAAGVGILVITPAILTWHSSRREPVAPGRRIELAFLAAGTLGLSLVAFDDRFVPMSAAMQMPYAMFPVMFWAALRFGPREVATTLLLTGLVAGWCTASGVGPFAHGDRLEGLVSLYLFLAILGTTGLLFAAALRQREEADARVRASEQQHRLLLDRMNEGLVMQDRDGVMTFVSDRFCEITGYRRDDLLGKTGREIAAPEEAERWADRHRLRQQGVGDSFELTLVKGNGERMAAYISPRPLFDDRGRYAGSFALLTDVTARHRAEEALRESEEKYRLLVENQSDLVLKLGRDGTVNFVSPSYQQLFGVAESELLGKPLALRVHEDDREVTARAWQAVWEPPHALTIENRVMTPHGWRWFAWSAKAIRDDRSMAQASSVVAVARDITARRRAEEQARQHLQQLAHVSRVSSMGEMASAIAHEINQPLTAIANYAYACVRMLRAGQTTREEALGVMQRVAAEAERAGEVVRKMRSFVRGEEGQLAAIDANFLVSEVLRLAAPEARQSGVELVPLLTPNLPGVLCDSIQIQQVLLNLVRNAVEAINSHATEVREVRIATGRGPGPFVEITVEDTGPGLAEDALERVFDPFFTTKPDGIGIGLALSRSIADAHGGTLRASGTLGRGATFRLTLPTADEPAITES